MRKLRLSAALAVVEVEIVGRFHGLVQRLQRVHRIGYPIGTLQARTRLGERTDPERVYICVEHGINGRRGTEARSVAA